MERKRILTGDRPTGKMHLGHYVGSLVNRVRLQDEYECFFIIADLHTLTTRPEKEHIEEIATNAREMTLDYLAVGIDPRKSTIYLQSAVHEVYELNLIFEMLVTVPRLSRLPSLKDMARAADLTEMPFGLLGYPVLQAADILMPRAHLVPVGKDNEAHVEVTREIARHFNYLYGEVFPIPEVMIGEVPTLVDTDGQAKMSKSMNNAIGLLDPPEMMWEKLRPAMTCEHRQRRTDPGHPEHCNIFTMHTAFSKADRIDFVEKACREAGIGCIECKRMLFEAMVEEIAPIQDRVRDIHNSPGYIVDVLRTGAERCRAMAQEVMDEVRTKLGIKPNW